MNRGKNLRAKTLETLSPTMTALWDLEYFPVFPLSVTYDPFFYRTQSPRSRYFSNQRLSLWLT